MNETLIELEQVVVLRHTEPTGIFGLWGAKPVRALDGVSLQLRRGETLGIVGGSGGGKTTLAEVSTMRRPADRGRVLVEGREAARLSSNERKRLQRRFQIIRQDARESLDLDQRVGRQLQDVVRHAGLGDVEVRAARAMEQVELPRSFLDRKAGELSGGEQQRLAIARALALNPVMIAADEPVSGVDPRLKLELINLLLRVQRESKLALLLISQDVQVIRRMAQRAAVLHAGRLYELGPTERVLGEPFHPYSRLFLGHQPGEAPSEEDLVGRTVVGCPWAPCCTVAIDRCKTERPAMREVGPGHGVACHVVGQEGS